MVSVDVWLPLSLILSHYRFHLQGALDDGPMGCTEMSLKTNIRCVPFEKSGVSGILLGLLDP
jgi:hypothetical protein